MAVAQTDETLATDAKLRFTGIPEASEAVAPEMEIDALIENLRRNCEPYARAELGVSLETLQTCLSRRNLELEKLEQFLRKEMRQRQIAEARLRLLSRLDAAKSLANQAIVRSVNEAELFAAICRIAVEHVGVARAWIGHFDSASNRLTPVANYGEGRDDPHDLALFNLDGAPHPGDPTGTALRENRTCICQDFLNDPLTARYHEQCRRLGWAALAAFAIERQGEPCYALTLHSAQANAFDEDTVGMLREMTVELSYKLDQFDREAQQRKAELKAMQLLEENRQLTQQLFAGQEAERKRIARELHDELGQYIAVMQAEVEMICTRGQHKCQLVYDSAQNLRNLLKHFYDTVHSLVEDLRPSLIDHLGLGATLQEAIDIFRNRYGDIQWKLTTVGDLQKLDETLNITVYRIVMECLVNIVKHARASQVEVMVCIGCAGQRCGCTEYFCTVLPAHDTLRLLIRDNGIGLGCRKKGVGLGLVGLRERVGALGGGFTLESRKEKGVCIAVELPLKVSSSTHDQTAAN